MIQTRTQAFLVHTYKLLLMAGAACTLFACSDYEFKFNERTVYTPPPLFSEFQIADSALEACVRQTIKDKRITAAKDLTVLACTSGGIVSLEGLEVFTELEQLNLARNAITNVEPLARLPQLKRLDLSENPVVNVAPLSTLEQLDMVDLRGSGTVDCEQAAALRDADINVLMPEHCSE